MKNLKLGVIGMGYLGKALTRNLINNGCGDNLIISDINKDISTILPINNNKYVINESNILFLTVKPNNIKEILTEIEENGDQNKLIISTIAGVQIEYIEKILR